MENGSANAVEEVLWWLGWHRIHVVVGGMALGLLGGYFFGSVGLGTLVFGAFLLLLAPLSRKVLVLEVLAFAGVAGVLYIFGGEEILRTVGISSTDSNLIAELILDISDNIGFTVDYPAGQAPETVGGLLFGLCTWMLAGFALGFVVWGMGAVVINRTYEEVYSAYRMLIEKKGEALLGERTHTAMSGMGSVLGVRAKKEYHASNIRVRDNSVDLNYGSVLSMPRKAVSVSGSTKQMYYDQLASVEYEEPHLEIRMADGDVVRIATSEKPTELLEEIETRLKEYKKLTTPVENEQDEAEIAEDSGRAEKEGSEEAAPQETFIEEESRARAEEAVEDIEEVVESALDDMGETLKVMDDQEEIEVEEEQVEVEEAEPPGVEETDDIGAVDTK